MSTALISILRRVARTMGIPEGELRSDLPERLGIPSFIPPDLLKHWRRVLARSRRLLASLPPPTGPRVAFITTLGKGINNPGYVAVMAYALRLRGAEPLLIYCDGALEGCEHATSFYLRPEEFIREGPRRLCAGCSEPGEDLYRVVGLPTYRLSEFLTAEALAEADRFVGQLSRDDYYTFTYKGLPLGPEVESSVARFFYSHVPDRQEVTWQVAQRMVRGAVMMAEAMLRMHHRLAPEIMVPQYGAYLSRGTAALVARGVGTRSVVWSRGYVEEAVMLGENESIFTELAGKTDGPWNRVALNPTQTGRLDEFLMRRMRGRAFKVFNRNPLNDEAQLFKETGLDPSKPIISLFANCGFDSKRFYDTPLYPNVLAWIFDSIELFRNRPEQLVIRVHPGELWHPYVQKTVDRLKERFPVLPAHLCVIPPESRLNSYVLARLSQVVLVYGSLIGLEVAALDKPVIVSGRGPYWQKGFTYDVHVRADYLALLDRFEELAQPNPARTELARRFAYYFYFLRQVPFSYWNHDVHPGLRLKPWWKVFRSLDDLLPGRDANLDAMCDQILCGREALTVGS